MAFVVAHCRKVKTAVGMGNVANHNSRAVLEDEKRGWEGQKDIPAWVVNPKNLYLNEGQAGQQDDLIAHKRNETIKKAELSRKPQKNAAAAIEMVFSASPDSFGQDGYESAKKWTAYLKECREWAEKKFGQENLLQWNTHYDEKTPHLHMIFVPIVRDQEKGNRYSSSEFLGGREGLHNMQTELYEKIGKKHGLERGLEGSQARHTNQAEWALALAKKQKETLQELEKQLDEEIKKSQEKKEMMIAATKLAMQTHKMHPMEIAEMKKRLDTWDQQTPGNLRDYAMTMEREGFKTVGERRKAIEAKKEQERQMQQSRGRSR